MKIIRHRKRESYYVVLMDMGYCARMYFLFFRGYQSNGDVLYKRIASEMKTIKERLEEM